MFGVLQVILRRDKIATLRFGAGQLQIALIFPLRILGMPREANVGGLVGSGSCSSRHFASCQFDGWRRFRFNRHLLGKAREIHGEG